MAGYGYQHRSSAAYSLPQTDDWSKPSYASDHVSRRPVILDSDGRKRPIVSFPPNQNSEYYISRTTETIVQEQVLSPFASEIKQPHLWSPTTVHEVVQDKFHDSPPKVDEFFTKVQNEASKPKFGPMSASTWHNYNKDRKKPTNNGYYNDVHDDNCGKYGGSTAYYKEPLSPAAIKAPHYRHVDPVLVDTFDERVHTPKEPTRVTWGSQPNSNLSKPTSDIPTAMEILKEVSQPFIYSEPRYAETIDSTEAAKRYGNYGRSDISREPFAEDYNYPTIDSREAARKYHGAIV